MNVTPKPFLRVGYAILGLSVALAVWFGLGDVWGWPAILCGMLGFLAVTSIGEAVLHRASTPAERAADLTERARHVD
jgi:hypothetical protein